MYELSFISLLALCMVSFIGVPHGSFDGAVAANEYRSFWIM